MPRRSGFIGDMLDVAALLPWKVSLIIAAISYFGFHYLASMPVIDPGQANDLADQTGRQFVKVLSLFLQYIVPAVFVIGGFFGFLRSRRHAKIYSEVATGGDRSALEGIAWDDFEVLISEIFRRKGYAVRPRGGNQPDGGVDIELWQGNDKYLVQCKQWKSTKVGVNVVRELFGVMAAEGAVGGFVVASGGFTRDAEKFAHGRAIELLHTDAVLRLISQTLDNSEDEVAGNATCPECGADMVIRTAKQGPGAGMEFWGCSQYPNCSGTRSI